MTARLLQFADGTPAGGDLALQAVVSNARSMAEVQLAMGALKDLSTEREILRLVNTREALLEIPLPPFGTGGEISILARVSGSECTGRSYRNEFLSPDGYFGLEFIGDGNRVDSIVVHAPGVRAGLADGEPDEIVPPVVLDLVFGHDMFLDSLVDALRILGVSYLPRFHMGLDEFMLEHAGESMQELNAIF